MNTTKITIAEAKAKLDRGELLIFLDARNPKAWDAAAVKLPGAIRVPANEVEQHVQQIPRDHTIIPYCT